MNAHTFDGHSAICPFCHRDWGRKLTEVTGGLYTCPYCQERLVVCQSGHYVRDPFTLRRLTSGRLLRRQSRPLARILRDFGIHNPPSVLTLITGALAMSLALVATERLKSQDHPWQWMLESIKESVELMEQPEK